MDIRKLPAYLRHPVDIVGWLCGHSHLKWLPDEVALKAEYHRALHQKLDLKSPKTLNEKLQWLKLHDRKPEYTTMVDKYAAKEWIAERIGAEYIIPTLGVWDHFDDIDFDALPDQFVLKCTHDSGSIVRVKNKAQMDKTEAREKLEKALRRNWFYVAREWAYKDVPPRIIAEEYLTETGTKSNAYKESSAGSLTEYKLFCFNGEPQVVLVCKGVAHGNERTNDYCDLNFRRLPFTSLCPNSTEELKAPKQYEEMLQVARKLSTGVPQLRVDIYVVNGQVYVGELTLYHNAGLSAFDPPEWDTKLGSWIQLPKKEVM